MTIPETLFAPDNPRPGLWRFVPRKLVARKYVRKLFAESPHVAAQLFTGKIRLCVLIDGVTFEVLDHHGTIGKGETDEQLLDRLRRAADRAAIAAGVTPLKSVK